MKKALIAIVVVVVLIAGGYFILTQKQVRQPSGNDMPGMDMNPSTGNSSEMGESTLAINSSSFKFSLQEIKAKVGQPITVQVMSSGQHTFTIDELGVNQNTPDGQMTNVTFTPDRKGSFTFYCAVPGHREQGQIGTIIVE